MRSHPLEYRKKTGGLRFYLFVIFSTMIMILYVSEQVYIFALGKNIIDIQNRNLTLNEEIKDLKIKVAELRSGTRIRRLAHDNLGMKMPEGAPERLF